MGNTQKAAKPKPEPANAIRAPPVGDPIYDPASPDNFPLPHSQHLSPAVAVVTQPHPQPNAVSGSNSFCPIRPQDFHARVQEFDSANVYEKQLYELAAHPVLLTQELYDVRIPEVMAKNRYVNILPPRENGRVRLTKRPEDTDEYADYINASLFRSHLVGPDGKYRLYIATQAPVPESICDFWRMVWEQGSTLIVMLTKESEESENKAHSYWNDDIPTTFGDITVSVLGGPDEAFKNFTITDGLVVRHFDVRCGDKRRIVNHIQYTLWPDHGVPQECSHMAALLELYRILRNDADKGVLPTQDSAPIIVHCSAGVGRTGTFIVLDTILDNLASQHPQPIDLMRALFELRKVRPNSIESAAQYQFCYKVIDYCLQHRRVFGASTRALH